MTEHYGPNSWSSKFLGLNLGLRQMFPDWELDVQRDVFCFFLGGSDRGMMALLNLQ